MFWVPPASIVAVPETANLLALPAEMAMVKPVDPVIWLPPIVPVMVVVPIESAVTVAEYVPSLLSVTVPTVVPSSDEEIVTVAPPDVSAFPNASLAATVTVTDPSVSIVVLDNAMVVFEESAAPGVNVTDFS